MGFSGCGEWQLVFVVAHGLLIAVVSLVHGLLGTRASVVAVLRLWSTGSIVVVQGLTLWHVGSSQIRD